jgi:signal transduction histidine kinase
VTAFDKISEAEQEYLSRVLALTAHELRTPLSVATGYLRMLLNEQVGSLNEKQRKMAEEALRACGRMTSLVQEVSDLRKLGSDELKLARQNVDLAALVAELASGMHADDGRDVRVEAVVREASLPVRGDRGRLASAVQGLMHAAVRERGTPGVIIAECSLTEDEAGQWAVLAIGDGSLIERLRQQRHGAFEYEWQGGMGLALPLARRIIEAHGGALWSIKSDTSRAASALRLPLRT